MGQLPVELFIWEGRSLMMTCNPPSLSPLPLRCASEFHRSIPSVLRAGDHTGSGCGALRRDSEAGCLGSTRSQREWDPSDPLYTVRLGERCVAPGVVWPGICPSGCSPQWGQEEEARDSGTESRNHHCSSQNSGSTPGAALGCRRCVSPASGW